MYKGQVYQQPIRQNLLDAGCDKDLVERYFALQAQGQNREQVKLLCQHRKQLLERLHDAGRQLDCLDYLLHQLRGAQAKPKETGVDKKP